MYVITLLDIMSVKNINIVSQKKFINNPDESNSWQMLHTKIQLIVSIIQ